MPNRLIKESIRTSKSVNAMTDFQFRLWVYLITYVDDYGRGNADPEIIKGFVFPKRSGVTVQTIEKTLQELATIGSILLYEVDGESYLCFPNWSSHQMIRNKKSKFPAPTDNIPQLERTCNQMQANVPVIQSNPNPNPNPNPKEATASCAEPETVSAPPVITLPLNTGEEYPITNEKLLELSELYPAVDIMQALRDMRGWLIGNPKKRKTRGGIMRFVTAWLSRDQNRGGNRNGSAVGRGSGFETSNPFAEMLEERRKNDIR